MENEEKYKKEKMTINVYWGNVFAILLFIPTILIFGLPFYFIWKDKYHFEEFSWSNLSVGPLPALIFFVLVILGIIAHELIHGITWAIFTKNGFKSIKFGIMLKMLTPYCHCKEPLKVNQYALGGIRL